MDEDINPIYAKYQMAIQPRKFIFKNNSQIKFYWDIFIICIAILNTLYLPIIFGFEMDESTTQMFDNITLVIDFFFLIDIIFIFRTTYVNSTTGDEIWSPTMIAMNYIKSVSLYLDIASTIPFELYTFVRTSLLTLRNLKPLKASLGCLVYSRSRVFSELEFSLPTLM